jgi:RNA polymerase sigma-70 factor (ECF subfamily)
VRQRAPLHLVPPPRGDDRLFLDYSPHVARLAYRLVGREGDVDDLVQDVFVAAWESMPLLDEPRAIRAWLSRVTVRLAGRRLRRRRLAQFFGFDDEEPLELATSALSPESHAVMVQLYRRLDELPVAERLAWTLRHVEDESLEDVAALCGCSLATAKRRIARAQKILLAGTEIAP